VQSEQQHRHEAVDGLRAIRETVVDILQENAPPTIRFINQLLRADYPDGTRKMLMDNRAMVTQDLLRTVDALARDFASRGEEQTSDRLKGIMAQAQLMT
jgi:hypothetical protein